MRKFESWMFKSRMFVALLGSATLLFLAIAVGTLFGSHSVDLHAALLDSGVDTQVLFSLRLPRALLATLSGGALAVSGALFQALLRNPLAEPYTLGVSGGSSLGAVIAISLGWDVWGGVPAVTVMSGLGAASVLLIITKVAHSTGLSSNSLLLAGITLSSICGAAILFLSTFAGFSQSFTINRWLIGALDAPAYSTLAGMAVPILAASLIVWWLSRSWNLLAIGEDWASARGISARKLLLTGYVLGSALTAIIVAHSGAIGFVGLIVPHALRLQFGADHRLLIPCSFLLGGAFLTICDLLSRVALAPTEIPVGIVTAALGGPIFIWMLYRQHLGTRSHS